MLHDHNMGMRMGLLLEHRFHQLHSLIIGRKVQQGDKGVGCIVQPVLGLGCIAFGSSGVN